jgi:TRAP-type uncharacterized transport system fused permease subunit
LLTHGTWQTIALHTAFAIVGVTIIASALEGYLVGIGNLNMISRGILLAGGLLIAFPEIYTTILGLVVIGAFLMADFIFTRLRRRAAALE